MSKKPKNKISWIMLIITITIYIVTAFIDSSVATDALKKSYEILRSIAPIIAVVLLLMATFTTLIKTKNMVKHIGEDSGLKGWIIAILGGLLSHGSTYIWYPILSQMRNEGAREGLIIAFFYARAIKLPWIPVMIAYFGLGFTLILSAYILLGAFLQGIIADKTK
ncbi:permease [Sulfurimonas sp.]|uniref:permease n=1 Tax=Sulfurimonas sp. TaxID=2022749 RepID=UPI003563A199